MDGGPCGEDVGEKGVDLGGAVSVDFGEDEVDLWVLVADFGSEGGFLEVAGLS